MSTRTVPAVEIEIRRAVPSDREALIGMYESFEPKGVAQGLPPRENPEAWLERETEYPNFIALIEGKVVGHGLMCPEGDSGEIAVFIHQDHRNQGLGKKLLAAAIEEARVLGLRRLWGMTDLDNLPMLRLARSMGFRAAADPREFELDLR